MADFPTNPSTESSAEKANYPYVGWIPTVNGRLSFRHIGDTRHPSESICANLDLTGGRIIVAYQRRPLSDILFPRLIHRVRNISGDFWFALTARSNASPLLADRVCGTIWIYKTKEDWRQKADSHVRTSIREISAQRFSYSVDREALANLAYDRACSTMAATADIAIEFELHRDGEAVLATPSFREAALEEASVKFAKDAGHDLQKWVADQGYFFLRDMAHMHQHHEPYSDTILILQDRDAADTQWRKNIIYSLHYAIIRFKRDADIRATWRAMGILAYCSSFALCCQRRLGTRFVGFPEFNEIALGNSLQAKANEILVAEQSFANEQSRRFAHASTVRTIAIAVTAIVIAVLAILIQPRISDTEKGAFPKLFAASTFAADNFLSFVGLSFIVLAVTWVTTHGDWVTKTPSGRSILEASYVRRWPSAVGLILSATIIGISGCVLFWPVVRDIVETATEFLALLSH
ncbi:hypothetical protein [Bradyrhizobium elkanii]|uniref:hypothetical protein n=1 Tax=Bradyrhizobium elkanii TaxID=29448 RepID=UPI00114CEAFE|nr:hypothetical protein [Bradyrhizobium elkanii]